MSTATVAEALAKESYPPAITQENVDSFLLGQLTSQAGFASVMPKLLKGLQGMSSQDNDLMQSLGENIHTLQDAFIEEFYKAVAGHAIDMSSKLVLRMDKNFNLFVAAEHPCREEIAKVLANSENLSKLFAEIASQSAALKHIHNLCDMLNLSKPIKNLGNQHLPPAQTKYQVSFKGDMNHFYFVHGE